MVRLRNAVTGAQIRVADELASRLPGPWVPVDGTETPKPVKESKKKDHAKAPEPAAVRAPATSANLPSDAPKPTASRAAWAAYAESLGVDVDGLKRNEIIAKLEA